MTDTEMVEHALAPFHFIIGDWVGEGISHGQTINGRLQCRLLFQNSFIEIRETLLDENGKIVHEDSAWMAYEPAQSRVGVTHFMAPGLTERKLAVKNEKGFTWWSGPQAPTVHFSREEEKLRIEVKAPESTESSTWMLYRAEK